MTIKLNKIIVIDIEATCWEKYPPPDQESEIIEIGICIVDVALAQPIEKESILVRPERSQISEFCTKLTTLTQAEVDQRITFYEACLKLRKKYESLQRVWASWGEYDKNMFEKQCLSRGIKYPFGIRHINVKNLFALVHALPQEVGMANALKLLDIPLEGTHHRGADDAWNISKILAKLLLQGRIRDQKVKI
ncbi:MAG: exonuclease domain-containing protein [Okeania sp. SIO2F4]|uniref:3'-5' exonuclease n=1 Tax=Okeania sp. SIO2F4 TaxID=2607790 RepID=UPI00142B0CE6|nr:3'-5' exonuclease [Okeania sp. SIO2F4]NES05826.1 exonuclease domain-containing protein [Okeania sp. SIO2F4]